MKFVSELNIFIDPSYTCTGVCIVDNPRKLISFEGFSIDGTKRALENYVCSAFALASNFKKWMLKLLEERQPKSVTIVMEAPFPGGNSSAGLYGLQFLLWKVLTELPLPEVTNCYSLPPSFIKSQLKKVNEGQDSTSLRKVWAITVLDTELNKYWKYDSTKAQLKMAGADRQTALGFWYFLATSDKVLNAFPYKELVRIYN